MDVQAVSAAALFHRDGNVFRSPEANRPHGAWVGCKASAKTTASSVSSQVDQVFTRFRVEEAAEDHEKRLESAQN
jgi:hypothetical protein